MFFLSLCRQMTKTSITKPHVVSLFLPRDFSKDWVWCLLCPGKAQKMTCPSHVFFLSLCQHMIKIIMIPPHVVSLFLSLKRFQQTMHVFFLPSQKAQKVVQNTQCFLSLLPQRAQMENPYEDVLSLSFCPRTIKSERKRGYSLLFWRHNIVPHPRMFQNATGNSPMWGFSLVCSKTSEYLLHQLVSCLSSVQKSSLVYHVRFLSSAQNHLTIS